MLAIAGAKGGCGKSTVALGYARALADQGTPAIVIDADRQQPALHTMTGVDRSPTLGDISVTDDVASIAQTWPGHPDVGIVPAPLSDRPLDVAATLNRLDAEGTRLIVDCPPGTGPDLVDALGPSDLALVVSTTTSTGIDDAISTVETADRIGVDVVGTVANRASTPPTELLDRTDLPVLATIPDRASPLEAASVEEAFAELLGAIRRAEIDRPELDVRVVDKLSTGIEPLDRELDGGLAPGTVVALRADPGSQSEMLLYAFTAARGTLYCSTERSPAVVRDQMDAASGNPGDATIRHLDGPSPFETATDLIEALPAKANLVIDPMNPLERLDQDDYDDFLNATVERMRETGGIALFHCLTESTPTNRATTEHFADVVIELESATDDDSVRQIATVSKSRRNPAPGDRIEIDLSDDLGVDVESDEG